MTASAPGAKLITAPAASDLLEIIVTGPIKSVVRVDALAGALPAAARNGTVILNGATPVTVANTNVTANSAIIVTLKTVGGTVSPNAPNIQTITPGTGFTIAGTASDTSTYNYTIIG